MPHKTAATVAHTHWHRYRQEPGRVRALSVLPPGTDIKRPPQHVRSVPSGDIRSLSTGIGGARIQGTHVPVQEPSPASIAEIARCARPLQHSLICWPHPFGRK
jgi:hypothetical protein